MKLELASVAETKGAITEGLAGVKTSLALVSDEQGTFLTWHTWLQIIFTQNVFFSALNVLSIFFKSFQKCAHQSACFFFLWLLNHFGQQRQRAKAGYFGPKPTSAPLVLQCPLVVKGVWLEIFRTSFYASAGCNILQHYLVYQIPLLPTCFCFVLFFLSKKGSVCAKSDQICRPNKADESTDNRGGCLHISDCNMFLPAETAACTDIIQAGKVQKICCRIIFQPPCCPTRYSNMSVTQESSLASTDAVNIRNRLSRWVKLHIRLHLH